MDHRMAPLAERDTVGDWQGARRVHAPVSVGQAADDHDGAVRVPSRLFRPIADWQSPQAAERHRLGRFHSRRVLEHRVIVAQVHRALEPAQVHVEQSITLVHDDLHAAAVGVRLE